MTDTYTREEEDAFEYVCRHTLLRPRDLMTIGERLAALRPDERRNEHRLKEAVNQAATEIAHEYLAEIAPYIGDLELERLFQRLPGPVLTRAEVEAILDADGADGARRRRMLFTRCTASACSATCSTTACAANGGSASCAPARRRSSRTAVLPRGDALPRPPGAVGRDRPRSTRRFCSASTA